MMKTSEMKKEIERRGFTIENGLLKGRYKITNNELRTYQTVRFRHSRLNNELMILVLKTDVDGEEYWTERSLENFLSMC